MRIVFNTLEGNYALCLLGNLIQMAHIERDHAQTEKLYPTFVVRYLSKTYQVIFFNEERLCTELECSPRKKRINIFTYQI